METLFDVAPAAVNGSEVLLGRTLSAAGRASELLATAMLLERGHKVAVPVVDDDGVDLVVDYRTTVQVKSSGLMDVYAGRSYEGRYRYFVFKSVRWAWNADVFMFRGVSPDGDFWWVVPQRVLRESGVKSAISVLPPSATNVHSRWTSALAPYLDGWHVFDAA